MKNGEAMFCGLRSRCRANIAESAAIKEEKKMANLDQQDWRNNAPLLNWPITFMYAVNNRILFNLTQP